MGFSFAIFLPGAASALGGYSGEPTFDLSSPKTLIGLLIGGVIVNVLMVPALVLAKWTLLSIFKYRPKILRVSGVVLAELLILFGVTLLPQWPNTETKWLFSVAVFASCAMFPNRLLLPATNPGVGNWFIKRPIYALGLGCVSIVCAVVVLLVLEAGVRWLIPV
jgi:hypothetical protein